MKNVLVAGPDYWMEFGWRLMRWQGHIRYLSAKYDETVVLTRPEHWPIYADFAVKEPTGMVNMHGMKGVCFHYIQPSSDICEGTRLDQMFHRYGKRVESGSVALLHARSDARSVIGNRNWPRASWDKLVAKLTGLGYDLYSIGSSLGAMRLENTCDIRACPIEALMDRMSRATMTIGPSSGPMHLASLCGCPHLVWTDSKRWNLGGQKGTNQQRYSRVWNPFKTPCVVMDKDNWQPSVASVVKEIQAFAGRLKK